MIINNFSFNGALGKSLNLAGSKVFSIPHTINVPHQYSINTNIIGDFIASSLNGKLLLFKRSNRLTFCALKWNLNTLHLEFAASIAKSGESFLARGLDWILTNKSFVWVLDDSPFISAVSLPSTLSLEENFSIHTCYSLLPHIGDFQLIHNFLIRLDDNSPIFNHIIPLEFHDNFSFDSYTLINQDFSLDSSDYHIIFHNGELWGRGMFSFGQVFILPAVFNSNGSVQRYYLYFQNCNSTFNLANFSENNSIAPAFFGNSLYGFKYREHHNLCSVSLDTRVFNPNSDDWILLSQFNGNIFADNFANRGLLLDSAEVILLHDNISHFDCNSLATWIAPADTVDALDEGIIFASDDISVFVNHSDSGFFREFMRNKVFPISTPNDSGYRFSFGLSKNNNRNILNVNQIHSDYTSMSPILWNNVYKHALDIQLVNVLHNVPLYDFVRCLEFNHEGGVTEHFSTFKNMQSPCFLQDIGTFHFLSSYYHYSSAHVISNHDSNVNGFDKMAVGVVYSWMHEDGDIRRTKAVITDISQSVYFFNPLDGSINGPIILNANIPHKIHDGIARKGFKYLYTAIINNKLGFWGFMITYDSYGDFEDEENYFIPVCDCPDYIATWSHSYEYSYIGFGGEWWFEVAQWKGNEGLILDGLLFQSDSVDFVLNNNLNTSLAVFHEASSLSLFALDCSDILDVHSLAQRIKNRSYSSFSNPTLRGASDLITCATLSDDTSKVLNSQNKFTFLHNLHFLALGTSKPYSDSTPLFDIYIFRSRLHHDTFNFDSEFERRFHS